MKALAIKIALTISLCSAMVFNAKAGWFYEHKYIGDIAFKKFIIENNLEKFFSEDLKFRKFGIGANDIAIPFTRPDIRDYYTGMFAFSDSVDSYSYGDFSGLAADHTIDFIQLYESLFNSQTLFENLSGKTLFPALSAQIKAALASHYAGIEQFKNQGNFSSKDYLLIAAEDYSHFQRPPQSFEEMLRMINSDFLNIIDSLASTSVDKNHPENAKKKTIRQSFDSKLLELNNASKYAILHLLAIEAIKLAGQDFAKKNKRYVVYIKMAFIINAFADHFLQDAFAGGHLPVQRDKNGLDNNGIHDFYCRIGLNVQNSMGEKWKTYGDNFYDSVTFSHAIEANIKSIEDLWHWFDSSKTIYSRPNSRLTTLYANMISGAIDEKEWPHLLRTTFSAYDYMPVPLNEATYRDSIKLKRGSKQGAFYEAGASSSFKPGQFMDNFMLHAAAGLGYLYIKLGPHSKNLDKRFSKKSESVVWIGLSLNYKYFHSENSDISLAGPGFHFTYKDRIAFDQIIGYSFPKSGGRVIFYSACGVELKYLQFRIAPSLKYFIDFQNRRTPVQGICLSFRYY